MQEKSRSVRHRKISYPQPTEFRLQLLQDLPLPRWTPLTVKILHVISCGMQMKTALSAAGSADTLSRPRFLHPTPRAHIQLSGPRQPPPPGSKKLVRHRLTNTPFPKGFRSEDIKARSGCLILRHMYTWFLTTLPPLASPDRRDRICPANPSLYNQSPYSKFISPHPERFPGSHSRVV
ncbi:hypothetical protein DENSPDRAFT_852954 [Dentipellis sp. KUC8613]|nr:hypothetical protein DENSPDRAFT_852954 [Dentipellis sp. KUC8613]